jgi:putative transposase
MSKKSCLEDSKHMMQQNIMEHPFPTFENGPGKEELIQKRLLEDTISISSLTRTTLSTNLTYQNGTPTFYMPEYLQENNETISADNLLICDQDIQDMQLLKTSAQDLITRDMASEPFWNNCSKEMSNMLWLPTLTDFPDSVSTFLNGCSANSEQYWKVWKRQRPIQETSWLKMSWKFLPSLQPVTMVNENTLVTRKIKIHPSRKQKELFQKCISATRYFYNKAVSKINELYSKRKEEFEASPTCVHCSEPKAANSYCCDRHVKKSLPWKLQISLISLRKLVLKSDEEIRGTKEEWQCEVPYDTRQLAIKDAVSAYHSAVKNKMRGNIQQFELGYKSRRSPSQLFWVDSAAIKIKGATLQIFSRRLGKKDCSLRIRKRQRKKLPASIDQDCKIMKYGKSYYLVYTMNQPKEEISTVKYPLISLDPGVRTFQTGYSPAGVAIKIGERQGILLKQLHNRLDQLRSKKSKAVKHMRYNLRSKCLAMEHQIKNVVDDLHNQTASYLTNQYDSILLPTFCTSVMQVGRELSADTKRNLWTLSHYRFQQKLKGQCSKKKVQLYNIGEEYTTKTCGGCGTLNVVGSQKQFRCRSCPYEMDRDIHGARNILLKQLTHHGIKSDAL